MSGPETLKKAILTQTRVGCEKIRLKIRPKGEKNERESPSGLSLVGGYALSVNRGRPSLNYANGFV